MPDTVTPVKVYSVFQHMVEFPEQYLHDEQSENFRDPVFKSLLALAEKTRKEKENIHA